MLRQLLMRVRESHSIIANDEREDPKNRALANKAILSIDQRIARIEAERKPATAEERRGVWIDGVYYEPSTPPP